MSLAPATAFLPVHELSKRIRARTLSPVALAELYLARIERIAPRLNCFATVTAGPALEEARRAEKEIAAGRWRGPLHGIPYGVKDLLDTKGIATTWGARPYADRVPDGDATVVTRLRESGGVLLGKLAMIELAGGLGYEWPDSSLQGACATPWDLRRWAGGSSSGSGSAVAAGLVGFAIGSETWGSITCPSAFCGVTGLRPTHGVVSRHRAMALSWTMDKLGPMTRSALDAAPILAAIGGPDPKDPGSVALPAGLDAVRPSAAGLRKVALLGFPEDLEVAPGVRAAFEDGVAVLRAAGVPLVDAKLPDYPVEPMAILFIVAEANAAFEELIASGRVAELVARTKPGWTPGTGGMEKASATDYVKAMRIRRELQEAMDRFFGEYDAIVAPTLPIVAPPIDASFAEAFAFPDPLGATGNLAGLPAVAVPCGFAGDPALPVSLQFVGRPFDEARLLSLAALFQSRTDWNTRQPPHA